MAAKKKHAKKTRSDARESSPPLLSFARPASGIEGLLRFKGLFTGPSGAGKTMLGARFAEGDRVFIAPTELQAIPSIQEANPEAQVFHGSGGEPGVRTAGDIKELRGLLADPAFHERYDAFVLDSLTDCQRIIKDAYTKAQRSGRPTTDMDTWGLIIDLTARLAREVRDLPMDVCVICLDEESEIDGEIVHRPAVSGKKLPGQLAQYFNVCGYVHKRELDSGELRHQVLFKSDDRYLTKGMSALDAIEPPEPLYWMAKRFGRTLPAAVADRVEAWKALASDEEDQEPEPSVPPVPAEEIDEDDPFAAK